MQPVRRAITRDQPDQMIEDVPVTSTQRQWHSVAKKKKNLTIQIDITAKFCIHPEHGGHGSCQIAKTVTNSQLELNSSVLTRERLGSYVKSRKRG